MSREDLEQYKALWHRLDKLCDEGKGESEEAEAIRDESDGPWYRMTEEDHAELDAYFEAIEAASRPSTEPTA